MMTKHGQAKHGEHRSREYRAYEAAKQRCSNPKNPVWRYYGGRGIEFRFQSFEEFFAALGRRPSPQHSIDRKDNNGHYEAGNVQWATRPKQSLNRRYLGRRYPISRCGEKSNLAKLTAKDVLHIREQFNRGHSQGELGRRFGVTQTTISNIVVRRSWKHI
jgi:hypothetical protein